MIIYLLGRASACIIRGKRKGGKVDLAKGNLGRVKDGGRRGAGVVRSGNHVDIARWQLFTGKAQRGKKEDHLGMLSKLAKSKVSFMALCMIFAGLSSSLGASSQ